MNKPAVNAAGLDLVIPSSNPYLPVGEHLSPQSQPVLDIDKQAILNKMDKPAESNFGTSHKTKPHSCGIGKTRQKSHCVSAPSANQLEIALRGWCAPSPVPERRWP